MKKFYRILVLVTALLMAFALVSCDSDSGSADGAENKKSENKVKTVELSDAIKVAMDANNQLTWANYFLADDGTISSF